MASLRPLAPPFFQGPISLLRFPYFPSARDQVLKQRTHEVCAFLRDRQGQLLAHSFFVPPTLDLACANWVKLHGEIPSTPSRGSDHGAVAAGVSSCGVGVCPEVVIKGLAEP